MSLRAEIEDERRAQLLALPAFTLIRVGLRPPSGRIQGQIYWRTGNGLGPSDSDHDPAWNLYRAVSSWIDHEWPWGFDILAEPVAARGADTPATKGPEDAG